MKINIRTSRTSSLFFGLALFFINTSVFATPNGNDLLAACEHALDKGFSGTEGMMCTWYVTPCDCFHSEDSEIARVCLPVPPDVHALAREVTDGLATAPELLDKTADVAAGTILIKNYPCTE
ncbi:MAG: hypothetical protein DRQ48_07865 [Gammaproteobacteria bacterium]|nr:MAG: hypothetical protein DRQ48_07865 [Gammaproteobacteria bacterium]